MSSDAVKVAIRGRTQTKALVLSVDAVVVGLGAGGGMALRELARAGLSVIGLEDGDVTETHTFTQREDSMLPRLFWDAGGRATKDLAVRVLQGRGVGGSTVHNTNLCKRTPDEVLRLWHSRYALDASVESMRPFFEEVERDLHVSPIRTEQMNGNNRVLERGVKALGWRGAVLAHKRVGCQESGFCELGCAYNAKENSAKILVPEAVEKGAQVITDARAQEILWERGHASGVRGQLLDGKGSALVSFEIRARIVVLSGSAVGSALLVRQSDLPDPHTRAGKGLRVHPGAIVAGRFEEAIDAHRGIPQSFECTEQLSFEEGSLDRSWIIPAFAHPVGTAAMLPGFGAEHMRAMRLYKNLAVLTAMLHDETSGEVAVGEAGRPEINYRMTPADEKALARGAKACAKLLFAAGAREVLIPSVGKVRFSNAREAEASTFEFIRPHEVPLSAVHPMGTLAMGEDPKRSVVNSNGEHHQVKGLYVADGSLFPTSLGGPPQISIYAFAMKVARAAAK
jgi:choline dehydrogenase-like flavoprotein